jgi:hypothetical protein
MTKNLIILLFISGFLFFTSCKTYLIPVESLKQQFSGIDSTDLQNVRVRGPIGEMYNYLANPIQTIKCVDKKGNSTTLENSPSIEVRFTHGDKNKKTVYYFDRIFLNDCCVVGVKSRFISSIGDTIPIESITKIEIQDGKKNFHYVGK